MSPLLHVSNISKRFGGFVALDGIELEVQPGERLGLIGPNGSGKSTLVNCICGALQNEQGSVHFDGHAVDGLAAHQRTHRGLARSFQLPRPFVSLNLADNLRVPMLYTVHKRSGPLHGDSIEHRKRTIRRIEQPEEARERIARQPGHGRAESGGGAMRDIAQFEFGIHGPMNVRFRPPEIFGAFPLPKPNVRLSGACRPIADFDLDDTESSGMRFEP